MSTEQEYDAQPSSILEAENDSNDQATTQGADSAQYQGSQYQHQMTNHGPAHKQGGVDHPRSQEGGASGQATGMSQMFDPYDPMLDADPFGLSASMHFPTNYSFDQPAQR